MFWMVHVQRGPLKDRTGGTGFFVRKIIHTYRAYNSIMSAVKRIPVTEAVWKDLAEMRSAGQTYTDLLAEMIDDRKQRRLEEDVRKWSGRKREDYVSLSEIKD